MEAIWLRADNGRNLPRLSSVCVFNLNPNVDCSCFRSTIYLFPSRPLSRLRLSITRSKPLSLRYFRNHKHSSNDVPNPSFDSFTPANLRPDRDSDRNGKKQKCTSTNAANEKSDSSSGATSDRERIRGDKGELNDLFGAEAPEVASPGNGRSLWDFLKLRREKGIRPVKEKGSGMDDEQFEVQWRDILDPTPENLLALLLTGLLGYAVLQIFWQLLLVAIVITLAAFKYSVIAAILLALLVFFL